MKKKITILRELKKYSKIIGLALLLGVVSIAGIAQDIILKRDGSEIQAKVLEITDQQIKYKNFGFQDGPVRNVNISEVFVIIYQNGQREVFNTEYDQIKPTQPTEDNNFQNSSKQNPNANEDEPCTISVCGLWVACSDASGTMTWEEAKLKAPNGYRLPTPDELKCMRINLQTTKGRLLAREYWSNEDAIHNKAYSVTMDDGKTEKNKRSEKFFVRYVKGSRYEDGVSASQHIQTESHSNISNNNKKTNHSENTNNQGFVLSKKAEIIIDSYALMDGAALCNYIIKNFEKLGFCCVHREEFKNNNSATISIAVANGFPASVRIIIMDRTKDLEVWNTTYTNWGFGLKFLQKFIKDMEPFITE